MAAASSVFLDSVRLFIGCSAEGTVLVALPDAALLAGVAHAAAVEIVLVRGDVLVAICAQAESAVQLAARA